MSNYKEKPTLIPFDSLPKDTLQEVIQSFILREGTEYGLDEYSMKQKIDQIMSQLINKTISLSFDQSTESINIISTKTSL